MLNGVELNAAPLNTGEKLNWQVWAQLNAGLNAPALTRVRNLATAVSPSTNLNTPTLKRTRGLAATVAPAPYIVTDTDIANNPLKTYLATDPRTSLTVNLSTPLTVIALMSTTLAPTANTAAVLTRIRKLAGPLPLLFPSKIGAIVKLTTPRLRLRYKLGATLTPSFTMAAPAIVNFRGLSSSFAPSTAISAGLVRNPRVLAAALAPSANIVAALRIRKNLSASVSAELTLPQIQLIKKKTLSTTLTATLSMPAPQLIMNPYTLAPSRRTVYLYAKGARKIVVLDPERDLYA